MMAVDFGLHINPKTCLRLYGVQWGISDAKDLKGMFQP